ncbi:outer membrane beta-barrel protein [Chondrinema litorale]|uniref:outer membrane beta-barrel protein n=1 Tax=Chondrinema litorale TaxID=2994555 RepID=UPI002543F0F2|nr:outer membrane beta-barrel protein [Chondrinema litorale]UZR95298.1 outer membrane beta-barrel protein [Chondrinema litorale]
MKYLYSTLLLIIISFSANAQLSKGLKQIGGSINASHSKTNSENPGYISSDIYDDSRTSFSFSPSFGFFIKDNISLSAGLGYNYLKNISEYPDDEGTTKETFKNKSFTFTINSRFHKSVTDNFYLFLQPSASVSIGNRQYEQHEDEGTKYYTFSLGISPGLLFMINEKFGIESTFGFLGYTKSKNKPYDDSQTLPNSENNNLNFNLSPSTLQFGFRYYFE